MIENSKPENFDKLAQLITSSPPAWLKRFLQDWVPSIALAGAVEERQPTRVKMLKMLTKVSDAAALLSRALEEPAIFEFLDVDPSVPLDAPALRAVAFDIYRRATEGAKSPALANAMGKAKPGRGRAIPEAAISGQTFCALIIVELFRHFTGKSPAPRNMKAAEAAELLWQIAGGQRQSWGENPLVAWRKLFKKAFAPKIADLPEEATRIQEIRRQIRLAEQLAGRFAPDTSVADGPKSP
ncbi:MAG: hypothetical protein JSR91_17620 [Proteobacteria bacterium]|nr:hypothetical protein [Pseudomonadota bacterium]